MSRCPDRVPKRTYQVLVKRLNEAVTDDPEFGTLGNGIQYPEDKGPVVRFQEDCCSPWSVALDKNGKWYLDKGEPWDDH